MSQIYETSRSNFGSSSKALKKLFFGENDFSLQYSAEKNIDNSWAITGHLTHSKSILADELNTSQMLDLMVGLELGIYTHNRSIDSITRENKRNPNHILNLYHQELEKGQYAPTVIMTRDLQRPLNTDATVIVEIRENDILSQIKNEQVSEGEKISKLNGLLQLIATKNDTNTWDLYCYTGVVSALKGSLSMQEVIGLMSEVEEKRKVNNISLPKNIVHHFSQISSYSDCLKAENSKDITLKSHKIHTRCGGKFNFNIN